DLVEQLPALRSQPQHGRGPGHRDPARDRAPDRLPRRALSLARRAAGHPALSYGAWRLFAPGGVDVEPNDPDVPGEAAPTAGRSSAASVAGSSRALNGSPFARWKFQIAVRSSGPSTPSIGPL